MNDGNPILSKTNRTCSAGSCADANNNKENSSTLLCINAAAKFLLIKPSTLYAWVHRRKIPFRKHGSKVVFDTEELKAWSEKQRVPEVGMVDRRYSRSIIRATRR